MSEKKIETCKGCGGKFNPDTETCCVHMYLEGGDDERRPKSEIESN